MAEPEMLSALALKLARTQVNEQIDEVVAAAAGDGDAVSSATRRLGRDPSGTPEEQIAFTILSEAFKRITHQPGPATSGEEPGRRS